MNPLADLSTRTDKRVRVDHRTFIDVSADVDEHRRHAGHALSDVTGVSYRRASGDDSNAVGSYKMMKGIGVLIIKSKLIVDGKVFDAAHSKPEQDSSFDPKVHNPFAIDSFGGADLTRVERALEIGKQRSVFVVEFSWRIVKEMLDVRCQIHGEISFLVVILQ